MKIFTAVFISLFCFHFDGIEGGGPISLNTLNQLSLENNESAHDSSVYATTTPAPAPDSLETISIQDLLLSGVDGNEKIKKKIISEIKDFPKNFRNYRKPIVLTTADYSFPKKLIKYETDKGYIVFRDVSISQWYDYNENANTVFSYSMTCDPPSTARIRVGLPTNIKIISNFSITYPLAETTKQGVITIVIKNGTILKQIIATNYTASNAEDVSFQISYTNSNVDVQFEGPQTLIYNKVEPFLDEIMSSLRDLFAQQLNEQMEERGLNLLSQCSKIRSTEPPVKKVNLPYFNNFFNNLYVIPEMKVDTWHEITISAGPIVIDGFSFNSTEFSVFRRYEPNYGHYRNQLISRLKTGSLKGKFEWNYSLGVGNESESSSTSVFFFTIDNILFENDFMYGSNYGFMQDMKVYLGKTKLRPSKSISDIIEVKFAELVLSEYLKSAISNSLKTSLSERTDADDSQKSFFDSFFNN